MSGRSRHSSDKGNGRVEVFRTLGAVRDSKNPDGLQLALDTQLLAP